MHTLAPTRVFARARQASPTRFNLLLFGTHDRGQLDSEFFLAYWFGSWGIRAGVIAPLT